MLVNNAAVLMFGAITELSKRDFERAVSINLVGTFVGIHTSDEASYCNGTELSVDGGMAAGAYYPGLPGAPF